jgi:hypothetical protein
LLATVVPGNSHPPGAAAIKALPERDLRGAGWLVVV